MNQNKTRELKTNLLVQNVYIRDVTPLNNKHTTYKDGAYVTLDEIVDKDGVRIVEQLQPYEITPKSVNSYVDSADYRKDPAGAIINSKPGVNIRDCTTIQEFLKSDTATLRSIYEELSTKFSSTGSSSVSSNLEEKDKDTKGDKK